MREQLVAAGRERARSLGWTDCYTMTKALGERYLEEHSGALAVSVVRPSIIESALERPYPGWIEGFKMAEPIILAYGRGELPDFPAAPDGIIDIIPVDIVVNAIIAAAATPPQTGQPAYYQVCSGTRNPLLFRDLYRIVRELLRRPADGEARPRELVPTGLELRRIGGDRGPAGARGEGGRGRGEGARGAADHRPGAQARPDVGQADAKLRFLRRYTDLYRPYTQAELLYDDTNTAALHASLDPRPISRTSASIRRATTGRSTCVDTATRSPSRCGRCLRRPAAGRRGCARSCREAARSLPFSTSTERWCPARSSSPTCGCGCPGPRAAGSPGSSRAWPGTRPVG